MILAWVSWILGGLQEHKVVGLVALYWPPFLKLKSLILWGCEDKLFRTLHFPFIGAVSSVVLNLLAGQAKWVVQGGPTGKTLRGSIGPCVASVWPCMWVLGHLSPTPSIFWPHELRSRFQGPGLPLSSPIGTDGPQGPALPLSSPVCWDHSPWTLCYFHLAPCASIKLHTIACQIVFGATAYGPPYKCVGSPSGWMMWCQGLDLAHGSGFEHLCVRWIQPRFITCFACLKTTLFAELQFCSLLDLCTSYCKLGWEKTIFTFEFSTLKSMLALIKYLLSSIIFLKLQAEYYPLNGGVWYLYNVMCWVV